MFPLFIGPIVIIIKIILLIIELINSGKSEDDAMDEAARRTGMSREEVERIFRNR